MKRNLLKVAAFLFAAVVSVGAMAQTVTLQEPIKEAADAYEKKGDYQLVNQWIRSTTAGNYTKNDLGGSGLVRGMVAKDAKLYFCYRGGVGTHSIIVVDGVTGAYEETITLSANAFAAESVNAETGEVTMVSSVTLPNNDIKLDGAGNFLVGPCITSGAQPMQVYKVDIETGECTELINEVITNNPEYAELNIRFDAFGVWGDVEDYAVVMALNANAMNAFRWVIEGGVAGAAELVTLDPLFEGDASVNPGTAPQIMPISEDLFYVDGNATFPTLYQYADGKGTRIDCFYDAEGNSLPILGSMNQGHNGITDFELTNAAGDPEYFMCCAATNTVKDPISSFAIIKYADESLSFQTAELIYQFPKNGFGGTSNAYRTAPVSVEVIDNVAHLYCYAGENGFGHYTFSCDNEDVDVYFNINLSCNSDQGTVVGSGQYAKGKNVTIKAIAKEGYHFVRWSDGNTNATRTITVTGDITLTAEFEINTYNVVLNAENGSVTGSGTYEHGTQITLNATANEGYHFVRWSDGNIANPRIFKVTQDIALTAEFAINRYDVLAVGGNYGNVYGSGEYDHGQTALLFATANEGYRFVKWSDGNTDNPRNIVISEDIVLTAEFEINNYSVLVMAGENGNVSGSGNFEYGKKVVIKAEANDGYHFVKWSDDNTENPRILTVSEEIVLTAEFAINVYEVVAMSDENGSVIGAGSFDHGKNIVLLATPNENYYFVQWSDGNTENPRILEVTEDISLVAIFAEKENEKVFIVESIDETQGDVIITITAISISGFEFSHWSDGSMENPRNVSLDESVELYAYFKVAEGGTITTIETSSISSANVYAKDGVLYVENATDMYYVLDAAGKLIYTGRDAMLSLPRGVYMVVVGDEVEKVVL